MLYAAIQQLAEDLAGSVVSTRRDFHKYAESGWFEMRTASLVARRLHDLGYETLVGREVCLAEARMGLPGDDDLARHYERVRNQGADLEYLEAVKGGFTGVIGILRCGKGPVVALRFDIDALGVNEDERQSHRPSREGFASVNPGMMHACGHDGHAAIGLGIAEVLMQVKKHLSGTVKLIFQPAEEGVRGARSIVEKGHLDDVSVVLACHITGRETDDDAQSDLNCGSADGFATTKLDVVYRGCAAHAANFPQEGRNALMAAATATLNIYAIPRHGRGDTRINVGRLNAGSGRNVIPDYAKLEVEVRGRTDEALEYVEAYARRIVSAAADMHQASCDIVVVGEAPALTSDESLAETIREICLTRLHNIRPHPQLCRI